MKIELPYGQEKVSLEVDEKNLSDIVYPNHVEVGDETETLMDAIDKPVESKRLEELRGKTTLVVNDATRPTPTPKILEALFRYHEERDLIFRPDFIVATGSHRAPTEKEMDQLFGKYYQEFRNRIFVHDAKKEEDMVYLGRTSLGTDVRLNKMVVEAENVIVITSVEPHYFAGYTGGRKSIIPGVAAYSTIEGNHKHAVKEAAQNLALRDNPIHEDMEEAVDILGKNIFSVQVVLDMHQKIYAAFAGDLRKCFQHAVKKADEVFAVKLKEKADVVVTVAPYPMDIDLYQSQKALDNGKLALKDGGIIILISKCRMGVGDEKFMNLLRASSPKEVIASISKGYKLGYHKAAKLAEIQLWAQMWAVTDLPDETLKRVSIRPFPSVQEAVNAALAEKGKDAKVLFLMDGSVTVPRI